MTTPSPTIAQLSADARRLVSAWRSPATWTALASAAGAVAATAWPGVSGDVRDVVASAGALVVAVWSVVHGANHRHAVSTVSALQAKASAATVSSTDAQRPPTMVAPS